MKTQSEIAQLADETLKSIDNLKQVEANDFLFTRIESRLLAEQGRQQLAAVKLLSGISIALTLFIGLNAGTYYFLNNNSKAPKQVNNPQANTAAQAVASEYNLISSDYNY